MSLPPRLCALTPGDLQPAAVPRLLAALDAAVAAGLAGLLVREPAWPDRALLELARTVRARLPAPGGWVAVHDRPHVALAACADAVHLGFRSLDPEAVRALVGERLAIGRSTHAGDTERWWQGADYLLHGPVRATPSKQGWREPIGLDGLRHACASMPLSVFAIGGLQPEDVRGVLAAGARGLAVRAGILAAADPAAACARYLRALDEPA